MRCGDYMCSACRGPGGLCASCSARLGSAGRGASSLDALLRWSLARWRKHLLGLVTSVLVLTLIEYPVMLAMDVWGEARGLTARGPWSALSAAQLRFLLAESLCLSALQFSASPVFFGYWLDVLIGRSWSFAAARERLRALPAQLLIVFLSYAGLALCVALGGGVFLLMGGLAGWPQSAWAVLSLLVVLTPLFAYVLTGTAFVSFVLAYEPRSSAVRALRESWALAAGRRWQIGGVLSVAGLIAWSGVLLCLVGVLATFPLGMLLHGALFLAIRRGR